MNRVVNGALGLAWWIGLILALPGLGIMGLATRAGLKASKL